MNHEVLDDPVELCAVVVASPRELGEVAAGVGSMLPVQLHHEVAHPVRKHVGMVMSLSNCRTSNNMPAKREVEIQTVECVIFTPINFYLKVK